MIVMAYVVMAYVFMAIYIVMAWKTRSRRGLADARPPISILVPSAPAGKKLPEKKIDPRSGVDVAWPVRREQRCDQCYGGGPI